MKIGVLAIISVTLVACSQAGSAADAWIGTWNGPEGTYLNIAGSNGTYLVTIKDLDSAKSFEASAVGNGITFQRDGVKEVMKATNGDETGMKWLAGKKNCLTVKPGEGYCRS